MTQSVQYSKDDTHMVTCLLCWLSFNVFTTLHYELAPTGLRVPPAPLEAEGIAQQSHVLVEGGLHRGALEGRRMAAPALGAEKIMKQNSGWRGVKLN